MNVAAFFMKLWTSSKSLKMMGGEEEIENSQILTLFSRCSQYNNDKAIKTYSQNVSKLRANRAKSTMAYL